MSFIKLRLVFFTIASIIVSSCNICDIEESKNDPPRDLTISEQMVVEADNTFGLKLFRNLNAEDPNNNLFISPLSVSMALGMTLNGANGDTYEIIKTTLELNGLSETDINESYLNLIDLLTSLDEEVIFNIANSIWYRNTFYVEQSFIDANQKYFNAEVQGLNFSDPDAKDVINDWVNDKTNGLINKIIDEEIPSYIVMYLINAIYFKGFWTNEFDKDLTNDEPFYNYDNTVSSVPLMHQGDEFLYLETNQFQAVDLMYGDSLYSMTVLLPKEDIDINTLASNLSESFLSQSFQYSELYLYLPKFELEWKKSLKNVLAAMGMEIAFTEGVANFSRINPDNQLFIDEVLHKTYIKVDEEGTEAAAVTSVSIGLTAVPETIYFRIDKPFIFMIREHHSGTILFIGKVLKL